MDSDDNKINEEETPQEEVDIVENNYNEPEPTQSSTQSSDVPQQKKESKIGNAIKDKATSKAGSVVGGALGGPAGAAIGSKIGKVANGLKNGKLPTNFNNNRINNLIKKRNDKKNNNSDKNSNNDLNKNQKSKLPKSFSPFNSNGINNDDNNSIASKAKNTIKTKIKGKIKIWILAHLPIILIILGIIILLFFLIVFIVIIASIISVNDENQNSETGCSEISMTSTTLSRSDFISKMQSASSSKSEFHTLVANAGKIYDISTSNNFNPELVVIRAEAEGYSPGGSSNNYWGFGCTNTGGRSACTSYASFDMGVLGFINYFQKYGSFHDAMYKYAYINSVWLNPGGAGPGGCYYFEYIKEYMSAERASQVAPYCETGKVCSGASCLPTTDEDQEAYTKYQIQRMVDIRSKIFGIGADSCEPDVEIGDGSIGEQAASYAVKTFDNYLYDQNRRMESTNLNNGFYGYVDCSSMVARTYSKFGVTFGGNTTASTEYQWCEQSGKSISESNLQVGDLLFFNKGSSYASNRFKNIGHVAIYIGNGKLFAAHTSRYALADQVSVKSYSNGSASYFCRPY